MWYEWGMGYAGRNEKHIENFGVKHESKRPLEVLEVRRRKMLNWTLNNMGSSELDIYRTRVELRRRGKEA
jgi:ribosomal protein S15P/S13E